MGTPGLFRAPECVRDYTIEAFVAGDWRELLSVEGNYHRLREHRHERRPVCAGVRAATLQ